MTSSLRQSESLAYHTVQVLCGLTRQGAEMFDGNFQNFANWLVKILNGIEKSWLFCKIEMFSKILVTLVLFVQWEKTTENPSNCWSCLQGTGICT